jgi:hypothetical protein
MHRRKTKRIIFILFEMERSRLGKYERAKLSQFCLYFNTNRLLSIFRRKMSFLVNAIITWATATINIVKKKKNEGLG